MKNKKVLIRNLIFAFVAAIVLFAAYNLPQTAKKAEAPQSDIKTELPESKTDTLSAAPEVQQETPPSPEADEASPEEVAAEDEQEAETALEEVPPAPEDTFYPEAQTEPEPAAPFSQDAESAPASETQEPYCTLSVRCDTVLSNMSSLKEEKKEIVPQNGVIYEEREIRFNPGESVFNVLQREMKLSKIHMEFVNAPLYGSAYIEGIGNLYEFDCGELSGWMYKVNGVYPNYGCSQYILSPGDKIEWVYTCDLGKDVGGEYSNRNGKKNETE